MKSPFVFFSLLIIMGWNPVFGQMETEPNNIPEQASILLYNGSQSGSLSDVDAIDWYRVVIPKGGDLNLMIRSGGGIQAAVYLRDSTQAFADLASANINYNSKPTDSIVFPVLKGTYYLALYRWGGNGSYTLESRLLDPLWDEDRELNNDYTHASTLSIDSFVTGLVGHYNPASTSYDIEDWYKINIPQGGTLKLSFFSDGRSDCSFWLRDSGQIGADIQGVATWVKYTERTKDSLVFPALKGTYYIVVHRWNGKGAYKIGCSLIPPLWNEDPEPNNTFAQASLFPLNSSVSGLINYYDPQIKFFDPEDWFKIRLDKPGYFKIKLRSDGSFSANFYLKDSLSIGSNISAASINYSSKVQDSLVTKLKPGTYYMAVYRLSGSGAYNASSKLILSPKADFSYSLTGNIVSFENSSIGESTSYLWQFDDNSSASTINAYKEYRIPKNYNVCLLASNPAGSDTICKTIVVPGIERISPSEGGNSGDVTVTVFGGGLDTHFVAKIMNGNVVVASSNKTYSSGKNSISVRFDLRNTPIGTYDFVIEKIGSGPSHALRRGFHIVTGKKPNVWASISGHNRILLNTSSTYSLNYGNTGNTDGVVVPVWLAVSDNPGLEILFPEANFIDPDTSISSADPEGLYEQLDSLFDKQGKWRVYPLLFPVVAAGSSQSMKLKIKSSGDLKIHVWTEKPWFQSPLNEEKLQCVIDIIEEAPDSLELKDKVSCTKLLISTAINDYIRGYVDNKKFNDDTINKKILSSLTKIIRYATKTCGISKKEDRLEISDWLTDQIINRLLPLDPFPAIIHKKPYREIETCSIEFEPENPSSLPVAGVSSFDPNEKNGPSGFGPENFLRSFMDFPYVIFFENKDSATAPAHQVVVTDRLDTSKFDLKSFSFGNVFIGDSTLIVPQGLKSFSLDKMLHDQNVIVRVTGKLDTISGEVSWVFRSLDPISLDDIENPDYGFLPPNINKPEGEGALNFILKLKNPPRHEEKIYNKASIVFDANMPIITNVHHVTFDLMAPQSSVDSLISISGTEQVKVYWSGKDDGAGLKSYYVYYKQDGGSDKLWIGGTTAKSDTFHGKYGSTYDFWSVAIDNAGNVEQTPVRPDAQVYVPVSVKDETDLDFYVYPNPASDLLTIINLSNQSGCLKLILTDGKEVAKIFLAAQSKYQLNLFGVPEGLIHWLWAPGCSVTKHSGRIMVKN